MANKTIAPPKARAKERAAVRRAKPREAADASLKTEWTRKQSIKYDLYNQEVWPGDPKLPDVDGRRLVNDLWRLFTLTRDPIFKHASEVVLAYGLENGSPAQCVKRLQSQVGRASELFLDAVERMCMAQRESIRNKNTFNASREAAELAAEFGLPGASFERVIDKLCDASRAVIKTGKWPTFGGEKLGQTDNSLELTAADGSTKPDLKTLQVADNLEARRRIYSGNCAVRFLGKNYPEKNQA